MTNASLSRVERDECVRHGAVRRRVTSSRVMILGRIAALNERCVVVLASASPRRREILTAVGGVRVVVVPSAFAEDLDKGKFDGAAAYAEATAWEKARDVCVNWARYSSEPVPDVIVSADTVVEDREGRVMEKPADAAEAKAMLRTLSNGESLVHTGVAIVAPKIGEVGRDGAMHGKVFSETTRVNFAELTEEEMDAYVATGEPFDKAGGYGIQGCAAMFIRGIVGDYFNVMGFPLHAFAREFESMIGPILERA